MHVALTLGMSVLEFVTRKLAAFALTSLALCGSACAGGDDSPRFTGSDLPAALTRPSATDFECQAGAVESCTIWLGKHGDLGNCVQGVDICADGAWTGCIDDQTLSETPELAALLERAE